MKYGSRTCYGSKVVVKVKVFFDRQTDRQTDRPKTKRFILVISAELLFVGKDYIIAVNPFSHTTILQQTTLNIFCQKIENLYN